MGLATYKSIQDYVPKYADFIVTSGWFRSWFGVVNSYDPITKVVSIITEGTPKLLFTMNDDEMKESTLLIKLSDIRKGKRGSWSAQQINDGQAVWFV